MKIACSIQIGDETLEVQRLAVDAATILDGTVPAWAETEWVLPKYEEGFVRVHCFDPRFGVDQLVDAYPGDLVAWEDPKDDHRPDGHYSVVDKPFIGTLWKVVEA